MKTRCRIVLAVGFVVLSSAAVLRGSEVVVPFRALPESFTMTIDRAKSERAKGGPSAASFLRMTITSTAKRVEALAGAGYADQARQLGEKLLALDSSTGTKALLAKHAARAGHPELFKVE